MLKWFNNKKKKNNKGFTLVELVIVIAILAILVGLLAPQYTKYVEKSRKSSDVDNIEEIAKAFQVACADVEYDVAAGSYVFTLAKTGVTATYTSNDSTGSSTGSSTSSSTGSSTSATKPSGVSGLDTAMGTTLGTTWYESTKLKGTWTDDVTVTCTKNASTGSVTVEYSNNVTNYSSEGTES